MDHLRDAAGRPIALDDLPDDQQVVIAGAVVDAIPEQVHGFAIDYGLDRYPRDAATSHRVAMYVKLVPVSEQARKLVEAKASDCLLAYTPLTADQRREIEADPAGKLAEETVLVTLRAAVQRLRLYLPVPRQSFENRRR